MAAAVNALCNAAARSLDPTVLPCLEYVGRELQDLLRAVGHCLQGKLA